MSSAVNTHDKMLKILMVGDTEAGKTSTLHRYIRDNYIFRSQFLTTIGIDFAVKTLSINGLTYKVQIWDTAGQERFRTITQAYYRGAQGMYLCYDVTNRKSFKNIVTYVKTIKEHSKILGVPIILVCTKIDRIEERKVSREEGIALAHSINLPYGVPYYETSSKENYNINESMAHLIEMAAKCKPCCSRQDKFLSWSMDFHSKCTDIQKQCLQLALLCNLRASENMILPNDIILHIFQFVPVAEHEIYWYEEGSDNYMQAYRNLLETQFGKGTEECNNSLIKLQQKDYPKKSRKSCSIM